jgi:WD40 repeat protein
LGYAIVDAKTLLLKGTVQLSEEPFKKESFFSGGVDSVVSAALSLKDPEGKGYLVLVFRDGRVQLRDEINGALVWEQDLSKHFKIGGLGLRANIYYLDTGNVISVKNGEKWVQLALTDGTAVKDHPLNNVPSRLLAPINDDQLAVVVGGSTKYSLDAGKLGLYEIQRNQLVTAKSRTALNFDGIAGASEAPYIVAGSHDLGAVRVFNLDEKTLVSEHSLLGIRTSAVSISGDGRYVAANGQGSPGAVWDIVADQIVRVLWDTTYTHYSVQLTDDASLVMYPIKSTGYRVAVQNVSGDGGHGWVQEKSDIKFAMSVLSMDGKKVATGTNSSGVRIYDLDTNSLTATVPLGSLAWTLASSPKSSVFAAGNHSGEVVIADWNGNELARFDPIQPHYPAQGVRTMDVSNDGKTVVVGDEGGRVCLLSVPEKSRTCFFKIGIPVDGVTFAGNDRYIAMVDRATSTYVFDAEALEHIMTIEQFADGGAIHDLRDGSITNFGKGACVETNGYKWRSCSG